MDVTTAAPEQKPIPVKEASGNIQIFLAIITLVGALAGTSISGCIAYSMAELNFTQTAAANAAENARRAQEAATSLAEKKFDSLAKVANDTHTLVNSNMGVQLRSVAELARWKAMTTKLPADDVLAKDAEEAYKEHVRKQSIVDNSEKKKIGDK
jgi:hypothetical protein